MNLLGAQIREVPEGLRSLINIGSFIKDVIDNADNNARARVNAGERPDLLEDLLKGAHVHVPKLQEIVEDIAGRTHAKTMADFMMQTHNVIGLFNTLLEKAEDIDAARPGPRGRERHGGHLVGQAPLEPQPQQRCAQERQPHREERVHVDPEQQDGQRPRDGPAAGGARGLDQQAVEQQGRGDEMVA